MGINRLQKNIFGFIAFISLFVVFLIQNPKIPERLPSTTSLKSNILRLEKPLEKQLDNVKIVSNKRRVEWFKNREIFCLALNIYFESRNQPYDGQRAVAHVVMNRVDDYRFPTTVCNVIREKNQFSWFKETIPKPKDLKSWKKSEKIARNVYNGKDVDNTQGALFYHAEYVTPYWSRHFQRIHYIGNHIFYKD